MYTMTSQPVDLMEEKKIFEDSLFSIYYYPLP